MKRFKLPNFLALLIVIVLAFCASLAPAQTTNTSQASVEIVAGPPPTAPIKNLNVDSYTLNLAPASVLGVRAQGTGGGTTPWSGAFFYNLRGNTFNAVVLNKLSDLTKSTKLTGFGLYGFAGTTVDRDGKAVAGIAIGKDWKWFDQISFFTGVGISFSANTPVGGGIVLGASYHF